ncbi:GNAT family N-acetyltransferase [Jeotgalibacillus sp. R-1-5s-1]|uniref:GNAT family N-acetyltransferase n=1 Tax=Jeotgalibacillus sp. R-1-5s-1 TaxID=2555897 RepID=UPI00106971FC|nr:GNAT family N-acetyltransferase [Jeotgalibacillus sp. R-1-5s-1]TFE01842.1 GNAT family N-acetyltransferase [Jeotgalibacillus sp. R-1-5s-1]
MHLYQGEAERRSDQQKVSYTVDRVHPDQIKEFKTFQAGIVETLEDPATLQPLTDEEIHYVFDGGGIVIAASVEGKIIAVRVLLYPGDDEENLGRDLELSYEEQMKVVHQEISLVDPDFRGNGLQGILGKVIMQEMKFSTSYFEHLCCTVSPGNIPSIKDKFRQGMFVLDVKVKYGDRPRYIFYMPLKQKLFIDKDSYIFIRTDKLSRQKDFFASGYVGVGLNQTKMGTWLVFARLQESV